MFNSFKKKISLLLTCTCENKNKCKWRFYFVQKLQKGINFFTSLYDLFSYIKHLSSMLSSILVINIYVHFNQ